MNGGSRIYVEGDDLRHELSVLEETEVDNGCWSDLRSAVHYLSSPFLGQGHLNNEVTDASAACQISSQCIICNIIDLLRRNRAVRHYMGTMAQCRGAGGDTLREAGAVDALLGVLWGLKVPFRNFRDESSGFEKLIPLLPVLSLEAPSYTFDLDLCNNHLYLKSNGQYFPVIVANELEKASLDLAISCLGSLRDLSCGSALNRAAVLAWAPPPPIQQDANSKENGAHILSAYVKRYDRWKWESIVSIRERDSTSDGPMATCGSNSYANRGKKELRLLTNALGAIRNTSHSTTDVCQEFFACGLVDLLVWRLIPDEIPPHLDSSTPATPSSLPDASHPWREASFRTAGSLINLAEKCPDVAKRLASNRHLIYLLIETWGGSCCLTVDYNKTKASTKGLPLLHLGLAAILHAADSGSLEGGLDKVMMQVMEQEQLRKKVAQRREEERKRRLIQKKSTKKST
ncbi:hypothetical protein ACHAWF_003651 [Thalassiosira exigua]